MSQFYASIQGNRGEATKQGTKKTGIRGHVRGWNIGCQVYADYDEETGKDVIRVFKTGGSHRRNRDELIAEFTE